MSGATSASSRPLPFKSRTRWTTVEHNIIYAHKDVELYFLEHQVYVAKKSKNQYKSNWGRDCPIHGCHYRCQFISKAFVDDPSNYKFSLNETYYRQELHLSHERFHNHGYTTEIQTSHAESPIRARASSLPSHTSPFSPGLSTQEPTTPHSVNTDSSNRNKAGLPPFIKTEIEKLFQSSAYPPKCTEIVTHLNKNPTFCPCINHYDMSVLKTKVQNYIGNRQKCIKKKSSFKVIDVSSINDVYIYIEEKSLFFPELVHNDESYDFNNKEEFMAHLFCNDEVEMKKRFFLRSPTRDEADVAFPDILTDLLYLTISSSLSFCTYNDLWIFYMSMKNLAPGSRVRAFDGTNGFCVSKKMVITTGFMGCQNNSDFTLTNSFHPFCQVLCQKSESAGALMSMELSFRLLLKNLFGRSNTTFILEPPDFYFGDFSDPLKKGIKCMYGSNIHVGHCFFHRMQAVNKPDLKYNLQKNQAHGHLLSYVKEIMQDINCCKTEDQALAADNHFMNDLEKLDLKEFVSNHKKEFGALCGKLSWFWYFNKFPGLKLDNCAAESYYRVLKYTALFGGTLQLNVSM